jgi:drug/metabolite transporter (DMT)-like permease
MLVDAVSPAVMVSARFGMGALALGAILAVRGGRLPAPGRIWLHLAVMSIFVNVTPFLLIAWGSQTADSALAAVLNGTTPLFTLLFAAVVFRSEAFTPARVGGVVLGFTGVITLTGNAFRDLGSAASLGELALLLSSVCYGFGFAYARQFVRGNPLSNVTAQLIIGAAITTPIAVATGWVRTESLHTGNIAAWVILGILGTGIAYLFYYSLIGQIGATRASLVTYITPIVGLILGWLVLSENLGLAGILGMLLIIAGVAISYGWHRRLMRTTNR